MDGSGYRETVSVVWNINMRRRGRLALWSLLFPTGLAAAVFTAVEESQRDHHRQDADAEVEAEVEEEHHQARHLIMNRLTEAFKNMSSLTWFMFVYQVLIPRSRWK